MAEVDKIRRFTEQDWYGWAGAEKFENGSEPFIYEREMAHGRVILTVIADLTGVSIYMCSDNYNEDMPYSQQDDDEELGWYNQKLLNSIQAEGIMRAVVAEIEKYEYAPDLSYALDNAWRFDNPVFKEFAAY